MNVLFLCTSNKNRSKTAEVFFRSRFPDIHFRSAGLNEALCKKEGTELATEEMLKWADLIFVMEQNISIGYRTT